MSVSTRTRSRRVLLAPAAAVAALAIGIAGCGGGGGSGDENADPAKAAPTDAVVFAEVQIRPEGDQKEGVEAVAKKVLRVDDPGAEIVKQIDAQFKEEDETLTWEKDFEPWVGRRAGVYASSFQDQNPRAALIVASKDNDKANEFIEREAKSERMREREYNDVTYWFDADDQTAAGVVGDFVVLGSDAGFRAAVDAEKGDPLADSDKYKSTAEGAADALGAVWLDTRSLLDRLAASGEIPAAQVQQLKSQIGNENLAPVLGTLTAASDKIELEFKGAAASNAPTQSPLVKELPGEAWLALGIPKLGETLGQAIRQAAQGDMAATIEQARQQLRQATGLDLDRDILASFGDLAVFAQGTTVLAAGGGAVISVPDRAAATRLMARLPRLIAQAGQGSVTVSPAGSGGARGFTVRSPQLPGAVSVLLQGDKIVIAYPEAAARDALSPSSTLGDSDAYKKAQSALGGIEPSMFLALTPMTALIDSVSGDDPEWQQAKRYLQALDALALGGESEGDESVARFVVTLK